MFVSTSVLASSGTQQSRPLSVIRTAGRRLQHRRNLLGPRANKPRLLTKSLHAPLEVALHEVSLTAHPDGEKSSESISIDDRLARTAIGRCGRSMPSAVQDDLGRNPWGMLGVKPWSRRVEAKVSFGVM
jgi:hypothetical protein